ncbi:START-like domain-containing protein [Ekhidna sp.]|uniref:START-like domain-containing protein n=1 Tax=Ekhidna sp. TaxID=2608089 RepID=UPI003B5C2326
MAKYKYVGEFEFNASKKMLYPYFSTASGLAQWFADDVNINNEDKVYTFIWDGDESRARLTSNRTNHHVRFDVIDEDDEDDNNFFEFKIDMNELTQTVYVRITDYSDMDEEEASELWETLIHDLKEIVGG